jgi:hypothetical protein
MQNSNNRLTFFVNKSSGTYFLLDTKGRTLDQVSSKSIDVLSKYKRLMGFEGESHIVYIPDIETMKLFKKLVKNTDFSKIDSNHAQWLIEQHPEYFI